MNQLGDIKHILTLNTGLFGHKPNDLTVDGQSADHQKV